MGGSIEQHFIADMILFNAIFMAFLLVGKRGLDISTYDNTVKGTEHNNRYAPFLLYPNLNRFVLIDWLGRQCLL